MGFLRMPNNHSAAFPTSGLMACHRVAMLWLDIKNIKGQIKVVS